ncbi:MAG: hypothetical protein HS128_14075 [Ideonella sp.]|nr:hypothetical protein [Ideonella sp.]MCC7457319.1 hypothetical protein [Nitrospira sp.]
MTPVNATTTPSEPIRRGAALLVGAMAIAGAVGWLAPATAARAFQACAMNCAATDAACRAAVAACETKIHAYNLYMDQLGAGVARYGLPAVTRTILGPHYPQANLGSYRFGFADRQPPGNAMTDCFTSYFNNQQYVERLRTAGANTNWNWLLHEVAHAEQCAVGGGRERYARRWWDELEAALAAQGRRVDFTQPPQALAEQMGAFYLQVHDAMPMERAATAKAGNVRTALNRCCIDRDGRPMLPIKALSIEDRPDAGGSRHILAAKVEHGDPPLTSRWRIRNPGEPGFTDQPQSLIHGLELLWTPKKDPAKAERIANAIETRHVWRYEVEADVVQRNPALAPARLTKTIIVSERTSLAKPPTGVKGPQLPAPPPPPLPGPSIPGPTKPPLPAPGPQAPKKPPTNP